MMAKPQRQARSGHNAPNKIPAIRNPPFMKMARVTLSVPGGRTIWGREAARNPIPAARTQKTRSTADLYREGAWTDGLAIGIEQTPYFLQVITAQPEVKILNAVSINPVAPDGSKPGVPSNLSGPRISLPC